jgi:hypothetical protein
MQPTLLRPRAAAAARVAARRSAVPLSPFHARPRPALPRALAPDADVGVLASQVMAAGGKHAKKLRKLLDKATRAPDDDATKAARKLARAAAHAADSSGSSESEDEAVVAAAGAAPLSTASAHKLAFSLAGAARRDAARALAPTTEAAAPTTAAAAATTTAPPPASVDAAPVVSVCTGPACSTMGASNLVAALRAGGAVDVRPCGCLGECESGRAAARARAAAWFAGEDGVALPLALAAVDGEDGGSDGGLELAG